jgi:hypothetical protein
MALAVAIGVPRIGQSLAIGLAAGVLLAAILIVRRRARGPLPSSGQGSGANTVLAIDRTGPVADAPEPDVHDPRLHGVFDLRAPAAPPA